VSGGYILDHTAVRALAHGSIYLAARVFRSVETAQPLYVPALCLTQGLAESSPAEVRQQIEAAFAAPSFVFRPLDEPSCWAVAQISSERAVDTATAHAASLALSTGLPVLTRAAASYKRVDARIETESVP
jgi:nucleoside 2-deoxyribosyltransferase